MARCDNRRIWILVAVVLAVLAVAASSTILYRRVLRDALGRRARHAQVCTDCGTKPGMLPVLDPLHNIEQMYTNLALLEDHMLPGKTCEDCCLKHFRLISGLADEAISLDTRDRYVGVLESTTRDIRKVENAFFSGRLSPGETAKALRQLRKRLTPFLKDRYGESYKPPVQGGVCGAGGCGAERVTH